MANFNPFKRPVQEDTTTYAKVPELLNIVNEIINDKKTDGTFREMLKDFAAKTKKWIDDTFNADTYVIKLRNLAKEIQELQLKMESYILNLLREAELDKKVATQSGQIDFDELEKHMQKMHSDPKISLTLKEKLEQLFKLFTLRNELVQQLAQVKSELANAQNAITQVVTQGVRQLAQTFGNLPTLVPALTNAPKKIQQAFQNAGKKVQEFTNQILSPQNWTQKPVASAPTPIAINAPSPKLSKKITNNELPIKTKIPSSKNMSSNPIMTQWFTDYNNRSTQIWNIYHTELTSHKNKEPKQSDKDQYDSYILAAYDKYLQLRDKAWEELAFSPDFAENIKKYDTLAKTVSDLKIQLLEVNGKFDQAKSNISDMPKDEGSLDFIQTNIRLGLKYN